MSGGQSRVDRFLRIMETIEGVGWCLEDSCTCSKLHMKETEGDPRYPDMLKALKANLASLYPGVRPADQ
jgi:hypothetical protein